MNSSSVIFYSVSIDEVLALLSLIPPPATRDFTPTPTYQDHPPKHATATPARVARTLNTHRPRDLEAPLSRLPGGD